MYINMSLHVNNKQSTIICSYKHCYLQVNVHFTEYLAACL